MSTNILKISINLESWVTYSTVILGCILLGLAVRWVLFSALKLSNQRKVTVLKTQLLKHLKTPAKFLLPFLFIYSALGILELNTFWYKAVEGLIIINLSWMVIAAINATEEIVKQKFTDDSNHKAKDRKVLTQLRFIKNISIIIIITLAIATILWNIPSVKKLGTTILTSAGVIGIIVGVAAQKSIANLITGFQIAFTQPIKIDDEVVIEGEFGIIEDITLTYVVVKIWDKRRLVLPLNYFNDKPFVNWTFNSTDIIGSVFLYVDYSFPVATLRTKFLEILKKNPLWDKKTAELLVTNTNKRGIELRATCSAKNASDAWSLRCKVREQLIEYIQEKHPAYLSKLREMEVFKI